jgi:hypothetical protein
MTFNDVPTANIISITNDSVTVRVPHCATSGPIVVYSFPFEVVANYLAVDIVNLPGCRDDNKQGDR